MRILTHSSTPLFLFSLLSLAYTLQADRKAVTAKALLAEMRAKVNKRPQIHLILLDFLLGGMRATVLACVP